MIIPKLLIGCPGDLLGDLHLEHGPRAGQGPGRQRLDGLDSGMVAKNYLRILLLRVE